MSVKNAILFILGMSYLGEKRLIKIIMSVRMSDAFVICLSDFLNYFRHIYSVQKAGKITSTGIFATDLGNRQARKPVVIIFMIIILIIM